MTIERMIAFNVPGEVRGQGRPRTRVVKSTGGQSFAHIHEDPKDTANKHNIQLYAEEAMRRRGYMALANPTEKGITVEILCFLRIPRSMSRKKADRALTGEVRPLRKPDLDNVAKAVLDAMNDVVYRDDAEVTRTTVTRYYGVREHLSVRVTWDEKEEAI